MKTNQSDPVKLEFHTLPKLAKPKTLSVNQTTPTGALISWHIPDAQFIDGAVLSIFDKAKIGQGPIKTLHLRKNETFKFVDGLEFETKYRASLYAVRGENTTPKKEASFRTDIEITPVKECMVTTYDETMVRGNFQYDIMKRKPNIIVRLESKVGLFKINWLKVQSNEYKAEQSDLRRLQLVDI